MTTKYQPLDSILTYPETKNRTITLKEALPFDASLDLDGCEKHLAKLMDVKVVFHYDGRNYPWPGTHRNVTSWWALEDGHAVGWNENMSIGWSFPALKLTPKNLAKIGRPLPHLWKG